MSHPALHAEDLVKQLDGRITDYQYRCADRQDTEDIDIGMGKIDRKGQQHRKHRPRSPQQDNSVHPGHEVHYKREYTGQNPCSHIEEQKLTAAHPPLYLHTEKEDAEHVKQNVGKAGVGKHIGDKLPDIALLQNQPRNESRIKAAVGADVVQHIDEDIDQNYSKG